VKRALLAVAISMSACSSSKPAPTASTTSSPRALPAPLKLRGDLKPIVSVKELMRDMIDPASDLVFDAVKVEIGKSGTIETVGKASGVCRTSRTWASAS